MAKWRPIPEKILAGDGHCPNQLYGHVFPQDKIVGCCDRVCISHKQLIMNMLKVVSNRALMLNKKVEYLTIKSLRGKICTFLLKNMRKPATTPFNSI